MSDTDTYGGVIENVDRQRAKAEFKECFKDYNIDEKHIESFLFF